MKHRAFRAIALACCVLPALKALPAGAAAFYLQEQSVSGLGTAFAGAVADTQDASTVYYNPAGMTDLGKAQISIGAHAITPSAKFRNTGSTAASPVGTAGATVPLSGGNGGNPYGTATVPNAYFAFPLPANKRIWLGVGVSAPFGLSNKYRRDFFGRYDSTENNLETVDIAPSIAVAATDWLSLGAGLDIQKASAELKSAIPSPITAGGPVPGTDGLQDLAGDSLAIGFNAGAIIKPLSGTRIGFHYRRGFNHEMEGRVLTRVPSDVPGLGGQTSKIPISAELDLPDIASAGFSQKIGNRVKILGQATWFGWSSFNDIPIRLKTTGAVSRIDQNYHNTASFALGAQYDVTNRLSLKAGVQYDQSPTRDGFRSTRIPDGDRRWIAAGLSYALSSKAALDLSGAYVDVSKEKVDLTRVSTLGALSTTSHITGEAKGHVAIVSAALRYAFDMPPPDKTVARRPND